MPRVGQAAFLLNINPNGTRLFHAKKANCFFYLAKQKELQFFALLKADYYFSY